MAKVVVDLSHPFSAEIPRWPYFDKPEIVGAHSMAKGGVLTQRITCTMHTGTHCDAPRHVMEYEFDGKRARYTHEMPADAYAGQAIVFKIDIEPWGLITDKHLDACMEKYGLKDGDLKGKILCINSGMHRYFDDSKAYYHYAAGTGVDAGKWFVKQGVKCVAMDGQALDHPLHTAMGNNGMTRMNLLGATGKTIVEEYKELFGEEAYAEFDKFEYIRIHGQEAYDKKFGDLEAIGIWGTWEPCHKEMLGMVSLVLRTLVVILIRSFRVNGSISTATQSDGTWAMVLWLIRLLMLTKRTLTRQFRTENTNTAEQVTVMRKSTDLAAWTTFRDCSTATNNCW